MIRTVLGGLLAASASGLDLFEGNDAVRVLDKAGVISEVGAGVSVLRLGGSPFLGGLWRTHERLRFWIIAVQVIEGTTPVLFGAFTDDPGCVNCAGVRTSVLLGVPT